MIGLSDEILQVASVFPVPSLGQFNFFYFRGVYGSIFLRKYVPMIFSNRVFVVVCLAIPVAFVVGCQGNSHGSVDGTVTVDGTPVNGLELKFTPIDPAIGGEALAQTQDGGKYTLIRGRGNTTVPVGEYKVTIRQIEADPSSDTPRVKLGKKYTSSTETELKANITPGANTIDFKLES